MCFPHHFPVVWFRFQAQRHFAPAQLCRPTGPAWVGSSAVLPTALVPFLALDARLLDPRLSPYPCSFFIEQNVCSIIFEQLGRLLSLSLKPHLPDPPLVKPSPVAKGGSMLTRSLPLSSPSLGLPSVVYPRRSHAYVFPIALRLG